MVKHIVMWKVADHPIQGSKDEVMAKVKAALEGLKGQIEGLIEIEAGINFNTSESAYDVVLYSAFVDRAALDFYQAHPKHLEVANNLVRQVATSRVVVDYDI